MAARDDALEAWSTDDAPGDSARDSALNDFVDDSASDESSPVHDPDFLRSHRDEVLLSQRVTRDELANELLDDTARRDLAVAIAYTAIAGPLAAGALKMGIADRHGDAASALVALVVLFGWLL